MPSTEKLSDVLRIGHRYGNANFNNNFVLITALYKDFVDHNKKEYAEFFEDAVETELISKAESIFINDDESEDVFQKICEEIKSLGLSNGEYAEIAESLAVNDDRSYIAAQSITTDQTSQLVFNLLDVKSDDKVLDLCSGYGIFLLSIAKELRSEGKKAPSLYGIEIKKEAVLVSKLLLQINMVKADICEGNALDYQNLNGHSHFYNKIFIDPPFGITQIGLVNKSYSDPFTKNTKFEWLLVNHGMLELETNGRLAVILPPSCLFRSSDESVRKYFIDRNFLEGVILLPAGMRQETSIQTAMLVFSNNKENNKVKIMDATALIKSEIGQKRNNLKLDIDAIMSQYHDSENSMYSPEEIAEKNYNLLPSAYQNLTFNIPFAKRLSDVAELIKGSQYTKLHFKDMVTDDPDGYRILTSSNIDNGIIDLEALTKITPDPKLLKFAVQPGDIVLTTKSSKVKTAVVDETDGKQIIVTGGMIIIRSNQKCIKPSFLKMFLDSKEGRAELASIQKGSTIITISAKDLEGIDVPCPPMEKQNRMSSAYSSMFLMYNSLLQQADELHNRIDNFYSDNIGEEDN